MVFLASQWLLPNLFVLHSALAQERRQGQARLVQQQKVQAKVVARLAQVQRQRQTQKARVEASDPTACGVGDCDVTTEALDLSRPPTEKELRMAGQMGGALSPIGSADVPVWEGRYDKELKQQGVEMGIRSAEPANTPPGALVKTKRDRIKRLKDINLSFGTAMQEWNTHNYRQAALKLQQHVKQFPDSPWNGEALLHLGCDSKYNGRFTEAEERYDAILQKTSGDPKGLSYEIHQKAKLRWADLDIALGKIGDATTKLKNIIQTDNDWRRRTWAMHWLHMMGMYKANARDLRACGTQALSVVLASLGKSQAALKMAQLKPTRENGFSLAELEHLAKRQGVKLRGFRARADQLSGLPMPLLIHYDFSPGGAQAIRSQKISGQLTGFGETPVQSAANAADSGSPDSLSVPEVPYQVSQRAGHFLVVSSVNQEMGQVHLFDPQEKRHYTLSFSDLDQEWSGVGLVQARGSNRVPRVSLPEPEVGSKAGPRIAWLSQGEMAHVIGGCCGVARTPADMGPPPGPTPPDCGSPAWSINKINLNMYVSDTPLWYHPTVGPDVSITMSYNSQDATNQNDVLGNKWAFNYGSYLVEDTGDGGGVVTIFMPNSRQDNYIPNGNGGFTSPTGNFSKLVKTGASHYELTQQSGEKYIYDIPTGTTSLQPFLVQMVDGWGNALKFGYDANVRLTTITDALNRVTRLSYDSLGHITRADDPFGRHANFKYDANGNMVEVVDMEGNAFQYTYDSDIYITQLNTAQGIWKFKNELPGREFQNIAFNENYYVTVTDPMGQQVKYGYDGAGSVYIPDRSTFGSYYIDQKGNKTRYFVNTVVDGKGRITHTINPDGSLQSSEIDPITGQPSATAESGRTTSISYNAQGQISAIKDAKGYTTRLEYAANGLDVTGVVNALGQRVATAVFNNRHQPTQMTDARNDSAFMTYTAWGALATTKDPANHVTTYTYDTTTTSPTYGCLMSVAQDGITYSTYTYEIINGLSMGRVASVTGVDGKKVTFEYDDLNNVTNQGFPDTSSAKTSYVCCGMPAVKTSRNGKTTFYDYDPLKRLTRVQDAQGNSVDMSYDPVGNLSQITDCRGNSTRWEYDALNRVVKKTYADNSSESYAYDVAGNSVARKDAQGRITRSYFDANGNMSQVRRASGSAVTINYDALNRPVQMKDALGYTKYGYDVLNRVTAIDGPWANDTLTYQYDNLGRRQWMKINGADQVDYGYDALGRPKTVTSAAGVFSADYVGNTGRLLALSRLNGATSLTKATFNYDGLNRLTQVQNVLGVSTNISKYVYGYEALGYERTSVRTSQQKTVGTDAMQQVNYTYDVVNQLTSEISNEATPRLKNRYTYDAMGNRTQGENTSGSIVTTTLAKINPLNQISSLTSTPSSGTPSSSSMTYDAHGNTLVIQGKSGSGTSATPSGSTRYEWDELQRLSRATRLDASGANLGKSEWQYDGLSRKRIVTEWDWNPSSNTWSLSSTKKYLYDGMDVIQERNASDVPTATYTRSGNIGGILAKTVEGTGGAADSYVYFHYDGQGNVTELTQVVNSVEQIVARYSYDAWGNLLGSSGTQAASNLFRYATKEYHPATGLYDYGMRFYNPGLGCWMSRDPSKEQGGLNLYGFCANNPLSFTDPYGLSISTFMSGLAVGFGQGLGFGLLAIALASIAPPGFAAFMAVYGAYIGAAGVLLAYKQFFDILNSDLCPDVKDYEIGMLVGNILGGFAAGGLGPRLLKPRPKLPNEPPAPAPPGDPVPEVPPAPDVQKIADNTGYKPKNIAKVKAHVYEEEHLLDRYADLDPDSVRMAKFDANPAQDEAWMRLQNGTHNEADLQWLKHETAEAGYMRRHGPSYNAAHNAAQARFPSPY